MNRVLNVDQPMISRRFGALLVLTFLWAGCLLGAPKHRRLVDGKQWTVSNLNVRVEPSYCYGGASENCRRYGRLYTWESAVRACHAIGSGWRLPTDSEWQTLAKHYGGVSSDASGDGGKGAYAALLPNGAGGLNAALGGGRNADGTYGRVDAHGFYWTATEAGSDSAVFYNFGKGQLKLHRQEAGEKSRAFSVRCVR